jgi:hypothetical protein
MERQSSESARGEDAFMRRIAGAREIQELARSMPLPTLRADLRAMSLRRD